MTAGTNSAGRILAILDLFSEDRLEWSPEELMEALGYSRPTLYRYLKTLKEAGFLTSLPNAGFTLGPRVTELDFLMRKSDPLIRHGAPYLDDLAARYPCSAFLVRWYGRKILCVASVVSSPEPKSSYPRGRPMPLVRGAIPRAILAFLPKRQQEQIIAENMSDYVGSDVGDGISAVLAGLRQTRREGVAIARGEVTPGVVGVSAPIFDAGRVPIAALCLTSNEDDITQSRLDAIAADIRDTAQAIGAELSHDRDAHDLCRSA